MNREKSLVRQYDVQMSVAQLHSQIRLDFRNYPLHARPKFRLVAEYVRWLQRGTKRTTVRYRPNAIDVPVAFELPLVESSCYDNNLTGNSVGNHQVGIVRITGMVIKPFGMLDDQDARWDGFSTRDELREALQRLYRPSYGAIGDDQYVSIYTIRLIQRDR